MLIGIIVIVFVYIPLMFAVGGLAKRYGRDGMPWVLGSLFLSPIVCIIMLWCFGETSVERDTRIGRDEEIRKRVRGGV